MPVTTKPRSKILREPAAQYGVSQHKRLLTYDDYLTLPNDGTRYEIIFGELSMSPAPIPEHQNVLFTLARLLADYADKHQLGKVFVAPIDVVLSMTSVVEPDIVFIAKERLNIISKKNIIAAPDLVIEILSEATAAIDRTKKKMLYEEFGVQEYWLVDPDTQSIEQFVLQKSKFMLKGIFSGRQKFSSDVIEGLSFKVEKVFEQ